MFLKTPLFNLTEFPNVYDPSEDTFLLLDALESDIGEILRSKPTFLLEVGSGSGVVVTSLSSVVNSSVCFAVDVNIEACRATARTSKINNVDVEICCMNLFSNFLHGLFDLIVFNPPYVVTDSEEIRGDGLAKAWAGGRRGREVIDKFLEKLPSLLSARGVCYLVVLKENDPSDIASVVRGRGLETRVIKERKIRGEHLFVLKFFRISAPNL